MAETNNFKGVVGLTQAQFDLLKANGTIDVGGVTYTYDPSGTMYVTDSLGNTFTIMQDVVVNSWTTDATYADFGYKANISIDGLTSNDVCDVIFSQADASSGNYAQVCLSKTGTLTIYSSVNAEITIPTIVVFKAEGEN